MYGTNGPEGGALVVVGAVVVAAEVVGGVVVAAEEVDGDVVVAPDDVESVVESVVGAVLVEVEPEVAVVEVGPVPVAVEELSLAAAVDVVSLDVELENVLPIVIGETSPSAPETSSPRTNRAPMPTKTRICRRARVRVTRVTEWCPS